MGKPTTFHDYLAALPDDQRAALERLAEHIKAAAPGAEECFSYQMPAFKLDGKMLVWMGATKNHCAFYPGAVVAQFDAELARWPTSKGTVRFQPQTALPKALVAKLVKARAAVIARPKAASRPQTPTSRRRRA